MDIEKRCRKKAFSLIKEIEKSRILFKEHKPSIGITGEYLLRQILSDIMPPGHNLCQGFVINNNELSRQCDIIIYKKCKNAIFKSYGDLKVVNSDYVNVVIEVKSSLSEETFRTTLTAFEQLEKIGVTKRFLFAYGKLTEKSLKRWLFEYKYPSTNADKIIVADTYLYDWPDKEWLPNSIVALESDKYFKINHLPAYDGDWIGYSALNIKNHSDAKISCLQEFFSDIMMAITGEVIPIDIEKYSIDNGIVLYR